jgi:hypothetical protein
MQAGHSKTNKQTKAESKLPSWICYGRVVGHFPSRHVFFKLIFLT